MKKVESPLTDLKKKILLEIRILQEISSAKKSMKNAGDDDRKKLESHIKSLNLYLKKTSGDIISSFDMIGMNSPLPIQPKPVLQMPPLMAQIQDFRVESEGAGLSLKEEKHEEEGEERGEELRELEKGTLKRIKKKEERVVGKKAKKPSNYIKNASKLFADYSRTLMTKGFFKSLEKDLIRANLEFVLPSYIAIIFYTTMWAAIIGVFITVFFLFFNVGPELPIVTLANENMAVRFLKVFWIMLAVPIITFFAMYVYPSLEKRSEEEKINRELPFATIHMAAISGSMIDPTEIFRIIIITEEYPSVGKEFTKLLNQINVYGYDLIGALRNMAFNSPSRRLADLFNGLATAISSGGDLTEFFDKRANSLLFEHRLEKEKQAKASETFMDIYISVVIAAPMILMLLLMMLKIGGLGISLSTGAITISMILGVTVINIFFLTFLHLKQPAE